MSFSRFSAVVAPAVLIAVMALPGCGAQDTKTEPTASPSSAMATTAPTSSNATAPATKPPGTRVGAADLPAIASDRTFRGTDEGESYAEYYAPDGTLRGKSGSKTYTGTWKVVGEQLCFTYVYSDAEGEQKSPDGETSCYAVFKDGATVTWVTDSGELVAATYEQGNPDHL